MTGLVAEKIKLDYHLPVVKRSPEMKDDQVKEMKERGITVLENTTK
jgi:hypothetical protein